MTFPSELTLKKKIIMYLAKAIFYINAIMWLFLKKRRAESMKDILVLFYYDFLRIRRNDLEIIKLTNNELVTRARNPCPILKIAIRLGIDTKIMCKEVSEPVCKFVLRKLNSAMVFMRNYSYIRPYSDSCEEKIIKAY